MAKYVKTEQGYIEAADFLDGKMDKNNPTGTGSFSLNRKAGSTIGDYSHAEGYDTTASGESSHAEGQVTTAKSENQHVQGKFNIEDSSGVYADIIGNGTASKRSNAATVDWHGNAWYAGDVYVGSTSGTNKDSGSKKLATEEYVDNSTANINIPTTLPNPKAITFTGAANASYDGSSEVSVKIPYVSGKMDKNNPTGTGSFSLNRKAGSTIGDYSHAEGYDTIASGIYSHAEGHFTVALGENSHAEGYSTKALREGAHVEGYYTKASSSYQHVQGRNNIEDSSGIYADIIGNGDLSLSKPSNAATVDWSGNAWYAGDVYVGSTSGTNKDEGSKKLATEEYVDNSTASIDIPTTLPNPQSLTFTGAAEGTYDGSSALTVDIPSAPEIPTALPNPKSLTFTGGVNASYDGSSEVSVEIPDALSDLSEDATHRVVTDAEKAKWNAKSNFSGSYNDLMDKPTIPDAPVQSVNGKTGAVVLSAEDVGALPGSTVIPEALPNPQSLTFTGAAEGTYDGSNPLTVEIPVGADGKSAYQYAQDGGYTGTETEFAEKLAQEMLSGTTNELTPTQVYNAVSAGIPVKVQHFINDLIGTVSYTNFNILENSSLIIADTIAVYMGAIYLCELVGNISSNVWQLLAGVIATPDDIPTQLPNPHAITFTGAVTGTYDGSAALSVNIPTVDDVLAALPAWEGGSY